MDTVGGKRQGLTGPNFMRASRALISTAVTQLAGTVPSRPSEGAVPTTVHSQAARGQTSPRRYVGRTSSGPQRPAQSPGAPESGALKPPEAPDRHAASWSIRLLITVALVSLLGMGLRFTGITTAPVDLPAGVESTHAAVVSLLTGQTAGAPDTVRYFPPPAPWAGPAPVDPASGLPLYSWLVAILSAFLGSGEWIGRAVSIVFACLAGLAFFNVMRVAAGARAALYGLLFYSIVPLSVVLGQQYSPAALSLLLQALAIWALCSWRASAGEGKAQGSTRLFALAIGCAALAGLVDAGSLFLAVPALYLLVLSTREPEPLPGNIARLRPTPSRRATWKEIWQSSSFKGKALGYLAALGAGIALWQVAMSGAANGLALGVGDGGGGVGGALGALLQGSTYIQIIGTGMEKLLPILAAPLLVGGILLGARKPWPLLFHAWGLAALLHVFADASRIGRHDDVLLPLILPVCAFVGVGAAWAGSLPARVWLAIAEQRRESEAEYTVSPHTSWLLDIPEEKVAGSPPPRPQAQIAFGKSVAQRAQQAGARARRAWYMGVGNLLVLAGFAIMLLSGWRALEARLQPSVASIEIAQAGREIAAATLPDSRLIIVGDYAPQIYFSSQRTGWALSEDDFGIARVQELQRQGASFLISTDQDWLGHQPDYTGLLTSYSVASLGRNYILFDLTKKPAANDRLYFLESGHTLGGKFRTFWETHGGVRKLGYPISEEVEQQDPLDGQTRRVQYFERAVLEYHPENAGTQNEVMLAAVGRWATIGKNFAPVPPFENSSTRAFFPQTGHSLKGVFLQYWLKEGGLAAFGYPISEEMPEINAGDGKVYTVQYFERARFEWHPTEATAGSQVQLGLIGKQVWEARK